MANGRQAEDNPGHGRGLHRLHDRAGPRRLGPPGLQGGQIRNVSLPAYYSHVVVPVTAYLARDAKMREWIDEYRPERVNGALALPDGPNDNLLWAADVWYDVKEHWCLEAQRLIRAKRAALGPNQRWEARRTD